MPHLRGAVRRLASPLVLFALVVPLLTIFIAPSARAASSGLTRTGSVSAGSLRYTFTNGMQLNFRQSNRWQPDGWYDPALNANQNLAAPSGWNGANELLSPLNVKYNNSWYSPVNAQNATLTIREETAARAVLETSFVYRGNGITLNTVVTYTLHASGRVAVALSLTNASSASQTLNELEYGYLTVSNAVNWQIAARDASHAIQFQRNSTSVGTLLLVNTSADTLIASDNATNRYWSLSNITLGAGQSFQRVWELQFVSGPQSSAQLDARSVDVRAPGLNVSGGGLTGYSNADGAYLVSAAGQSVTLTPANDRTRYAPAVRLSGWNTGNWQVSRGGVVLASNAAPLGDALVGAYDAASATLTLISLDTFAAGATNGALSVTSGATAPPTSTAAPPTSALTSTATATPTNTKVPATATATNTAVPATMTATAMPTNTTVPATATGSGGAANLTTNGDFETGSLSSWTVTGGFTASAAAAAAGKFGAALNGTGRLLQNVPTVSGQSYTASALVRLNSQSGAAQWGGLRVQVSNQSWQVIASSPYLTSASVTAGQWIPVNFTFTANSATSRLIFESFVSSGVTFVADADSFTLASSSAAANSAPTSAPTATSAPTSVPTATNVPTSVPTATSAPAATAAPTPQPSGAVLEGFEGNSWQVQTDVSGGSVSRSTSQAAAGSASAQVTSSGTSGRATLYTTFSDAASSHQWEERSATWRWQRAQLYIPSSTLAQLSGAEYATLAGLYPSGGGAGWFLRVRSGGQLWVAGYTNDGNLAEFPLFGQIPLDRWTTVEIGLQSQQGPGVKRAFAAIIDGTFYGWFRQGRMVSETYDRAAFGLLSQTSAASLTLFVDQWGVAGTGTTPTGPDLRPTDALQEQDFRTQRGALIQYDWSTWQNSPTLRAAAGLYTPVDRLQAGRNLDRMPDVSDGWAEIEIGWPNGQPPYPSAEYFGPMVGFRKEINREENLEVIPRRAADGNLYLTLEAWTGAPVYLANWPMPGNSVPGDGDIIRARWQQSSATTLNVRVSYYDASAATWFSNVISGDFTLNAVTDNSGGGTVNFFDGYHTASSVTIDTPSYSIKRFRLGTLATAP